MSRDIIISYHLAGFRLTVALGTKRSITGNMMKVKLFHKCNASGGSGIHVISATVGGQHLKELEDAVNLWLQDNPNIKVIKMQQSSSAEGWCFVSVMPSTT